MNGIDKITARIENEAQEGYWEKVRQGVKSAEDRVQRLAKTADMEARKSVLSFKQSIVAEAFDKAEAKLNGLSGEEYVAFLAALAARAAATGTEEIVLTGADRTAYGRTGSLTLSDQAGGFARGLVCRQGSVSVNCTVEALMAQAREDMASDVAAELFG